MAVPSSALPSNALAAAASAWGETSTDELPDDNEETYGEAEDPAYAYARAEASFRRFSKRLHTIMAVRFINRPRKTENMPAPNTDPSTVVPELAHKKMDAPSPYEVGSGIYVNPLAEASAKDGATERSAGSRVADASAALASYGAASSLSGLDFVTVLYTLSRSRTPERQIAAS